MKSKLPGLSYANVIATLALFVALGGGAYAAAQLPKNSVGTNQLKAQAVTPAKLSAAAKAAMSGPVGPAGPQGVPGEQGDQGQPGAAGSPDTPEQVLAKLLQADGPTSGIDAERVGGLSASELVSAGGIAPIFPLGTSASCEEVFRYWDPIFPYLAYYRDPFGLVHLEGRAISCEDGERTMFTLPPGYRPLGTISQLGFQDGDPTRIEITGSGAVIATGAGRSNLIDVSGINFRCAPAGSDGCP